MQQPGPAFGAGADVGLDEERLAERQPARLGRQGHVQRQRLGRRQLMEQQRRQRAVATFGVVFQGHVHRRQQQLPQQRRHRQHRQCAGIAMALPGSMYRLRVLTPSIRTSCSTPGGIHTARCGGTTQPASPVRTCITPLAPYSN